MAQAIIQYQGAGMISLMTFEEFEQMPDAPGKQELIDGELIELPPAKYSHSIVAERIYFHLRSGAAGARVHHEFGYRIGGGWLQPDVSITRRDQKIDNDYLIGSPELAVEVLSPGNRSSHIERKIKLYFAQGAEEVWVVDPSKRTISICHPGQDGVLRTVVNDWLQTKYGSISLAELFAAD